MTAAHMGPMGHRGDLLVLDDADFGFPKFIGTRKWEPERITTELGSRWGFVAEQTYKPYPHCRILHGPLDCVSELVEKHDLRPEEIESIKVFVEGFVERPVWLTRDIQEVHDGQFSIAHGIAIGAHRLPLGKAWQNPANVFAPSVLALMDKVTHEVHPDYVKELSAHGAARPSRVEIRARGTVFSAERLYPKGSVSPDGATRMTSEELIAKFVHNADGVLSRSAADRVVNAVMDLESCSNFATVMGLVAAKGANQ
jgi:2-methylcitrate dehydratase PrpD